MKDYYQNKKIIKSYVWGCNLYGWEMSQKLPVDDSG